MVSISLLVDFNQAFALGLITLGIVGIIAGAKGIGKPRMHPIQTVELLRWSGKGPRFVPISSLKLGSIRGCALGLLFGFMGALGQSNSLAISIISILGSLLAGGLIGTTLGLIENGFVKDVVPIKINPNEGIRRSIRISAASIAISGVLIGSLGFVMGSLMLGNTGSLAGIGVGTLFGILLVGQGFGAIPAIQHFSLRLTLWYSGYLPLNLIRFLDHASERILLRKVGGGYIFVHRMLQDYFARLKEEKPGDRGKRL
jgi:hypothetical protein